jgi:putative transposase
MSEEQYHSASHCKYLIQYHIIWCPKFRFSVLRGDVEDTLKLILQRICDDYNYRIKALEVMPDHIHILTSLPKSMALTDFVRDIKANSSKWMKQRDVGYARFSWQDGYGAFSVSPSLLEKTINYIRRQEEHHKKRTFREEYKMFLEHYGIEYDERYAFGD